MDQPDQTTFVSNWIEIFAPFQLWCLSVTCSLGGQNGSLLPLSWGTFKKSWTMMANVFISFPLQSFIPVNVDRLFIKYSTSYCMCLQHAHIGCWGLDCDKTERASLNTLDQHEQAWVSPCLLAEGLSKKRVLNCCCAVCLEPLGRRQRQNIQYSVCLAQCPTAQQLYWWCNSGQGAQARRQQEHRLNPVSVTAHGPHSVQWQKEK